MKGTMKGGFWGFIERKIRDRKKNFFKVGKLILKN